MRASACLIPTLFAISLAAQELPTAAVQHILAAQQAEARQDCHIAALEYGQAARLVPHSGELRSNQGVALYCDDQLAKATATFQAALQLNPQLAAPHLFLGLASVRLADPEAAVRELQQFLKQKPEDQTAHLWIGYALVSMHRFTDAAVHFEAVTTANPASMDAWYALGQSYLEIGRDRARQLSAIAPDSPRLLQLAEEQYRLLGDEPRAQAVARQATQQTSTPAEERSSDARSLARQDELYEEARKAEVQARQAFQTIVTQAPDSPRAHQINADALLLMQNEIAAAAEYRVVASLDPKLPGIHEAIANCLMKQAHFADALAELQIEEVLQPRSARVAMEIGRAHLAMGDDHDAAIALDQALHRRNAPPEIYLLLGRSALRSGDVERAISSLHQFVALEPDSGPAYYLLARAYRKSGDKEAAATALASFQKLSRQADARQLTSNITQDPMNTAAQLTPGEVEESSTPALQHP